jgi:hypothetical protein
MNIVNNVTVDDLLVYCNRNNTIIRNLYHIDSKNKSSERVLVECWHNNNTQFMNRIKEDPIAKDVYHQQIMMMAGYYQFRLEHN